jgi:RimJ/RimL family protein N-acetyltransferase
MTDIDEVLQPVLPRELKSISDDVREVGAPPTPILAEPYGMRLADPDADADMISEWMNRPHLVQAWEYDWPSWRWQRYLRAQLDGEYSRPFIVSFGGRDFGYVELYRAAKDSIGRRYAADPYDIGLHGAIADLELIHGGVGPTVLAHIIVSVFELEPRCQKMMFDPDHRNRAARRVCEVAGCDFLGEHDMSNRRMALYALPRPRA